MLKLKKSIFMLLTLGLIVTSCKKDEDTPDPVIPSNTSTLALSINGLEDLGDQYTYEGWILVDGTPITTGTFSVNSAGELSQTDFQINTSDLTAATKFILTIEPSPDPSTDPSDVHILAGDFSGSSSELTIGDPAAIGNDFEASSGTYILATPTNGAMNDENSGVWWLDLSSGTPDVGLDLPTLPAGWNYEGWAVINGTPISTGTFTSVADFDNDDSFSSTEPGPPYPGEDFLINAPSGLMFPLDLSGTTMVISVEPSPDNSANPFLLKPLVGQAPDNAADHFNYPMNNNNITNPTGMATR